MVIFGCSFFCKCLPRTPREGRPYGGGRKDIVGTPLPGCPGMHCRSKELVRFSLYRTAALGGWNAGDGVPYGFNVPYNDPTHNETTCNAPITVCQRRLAAENDPWRFRQQSSRVISIQFWYLTSLFTSLSIGSDPLLYTMAMQNLYFLGGFLRVCFGSYYLGSLLLTCTLVSPLCT